MAFAVLCWLMFQAEQDLARLAAQLDDKAAAALEIGRNEQALHYQEISLRLWEGLSRFRRVDLSAPHFNLAHIYLAQQRFGVAEDEARRAAELARPEDRAWISVLFAQIHAQTRRYSEAEREIRQALPGLDGLRLGIALNNLALLRAELGDLTEARQLLESALAERSRVGTTETPGHGRVLANLALVCFRKGDRTAALAHYGHAIRILETTLGQDHTHLGMVLAEYSQALRKAGRKVEAGIAERRAKAILARSADLWTVHTVDIWRPR